MQGLNDLSMIRGFFYSDKKVPADVSAYIEKQNGKVKCLFIVDEKQNAYLMNAFSAEITSHKLEVYSVYSDTF